MTQSGTPDLVPVLSRGKHRTPRRGACFMEMASYLAGEKWSDQPSCTHPVLAALAREVNDHVGDAARHRLAPLVPDVIGLNGSDPRVGAWIAQEAALAALPVASMEKQRVAALALLSTERFVAECEGRDPDRVSARVRAALDDVPDARRWAESFPSRLRSGGQPFGTRTALFIVHVSVTGIAASTAPHDELLVDLLATTVDRCRTWLGHEAPEVSDAQWHELVKLTRR